MLQGPLDFQFTFIYLFHTSGFPLPLALAPQCSGSYRQLDVLAVPSRVCSGVRPEGEGVTLHLAKWRGVCAGCGVCIAWGIEGCVWSLLCCLWVSLGHGFSL